MTPRRTRMLFVAGLVVAVAVATGLAIKALDSNMLYFFSPSQVANGEAPADMRFRVGGLVVIGSVKRQEDGLTALFEVTDNESALPISYTGILPDLFREGQGIVAHGKLENGVFKADQVLAKHDENYMPPEVAATLKEKHGGTIPFGDAQRSDPSSLPTHGGAANPRTNDANSSGGY